MKPELELISFDLCPYVQRSVVTLKKKNVDYKLTFIDLSSPPAWFKEISPLGKVPVLKVREAGAGETTVLFESAVINEYLDEITPPSFGEKVPLKKAFERAWTEVGGELLGLFYGISVATDAEELREPTRDLWDILGQVEKILPGGSTFRGQDFSLVDSAFAPVFMRIDLFKSLRDSPEWKRLPKVKQWADSLLALPAVKESVIPEFREKFRAYLSKQGSLMAAQI